MKKNCKLFFITKTDCKESTVKPVYNDHPWDPEIVAVVDR